VGVGLLPGNDLTIFPGIKANCDRVYAQISDFAGLQHELSKVRQRAKGSEVPKGSVLVVVIVHDSAKIMREGTKWWGDVYTGVATQVLVSSMKFS
jgi:hypothetical protein